MAIRLKQAGIDDFVVFERDTDVGGTWWANTYPGCQCDIPSHLYSFSFAPNPDWTRTYPLQPELEPLPARRAPSASACCDHIRLGCEVTRRRSGTRTPARWRLETSAGRRSPPTC